MSDNNKVNENKSNSPVVQVLEDNDMILLPDLPVLEQTQKKATTPYSDFSLPKSATDLLESKGFTNLNEIGFGSYGKVYKAMSKQHKCEVGIKIVDMKKLSQMFLQTFLNQEIQLMKKLPKHSNVTEFYDVFVGSDTGFYRLCYIVMAYYPNGDLYEFIVKRRYIPERQACLWFKQLVNGVQHIHNNGFAHRDLKSENLLLSANYEIRITDFGFCTRLTYDCENHRENESITFCGSYVYASPELLCGRPYLSTMADIWSCGVILYVMLFGRYPNDGNEMEKFISNDNHYIEVPDYPEVSKECKELLNNILVNEEKRYTIEKIKGSVWFNTNWEESGNIFDNNTQYFQNLNIPRVETEPFEPAINQMNGQNNSEPLLTQMQSHYGQNLSSSPKKKN